jgi:hypothetical protein
MCLDISSIQQIDIMYLFARVAELDRTNIKTRIKAIVIFLFLLRHLKINKKKPASTREKQTRENTKIYADILERV